MGFAGRRQAKFGRTQDLVARGSLKSRVLDEVRQKRDTEKATFPLALRQRDNNDQLQTMPR
jgi:hypothetical protein